MSLYLISISLSLIAILCSLYAINKADRNYRRAPKVEIFLSLRNTYIEMHKDLPRTESINDSPAKNTPCEDKALQKYWYNAFNEWYVTVEVHPEYNLWDEFFKKAVTGALTNQQYRISLQKMIDDDVCFGSYEMRNNFLTSIDKNGNHVEFKK